MYLHVYHINGYIEEEDACKYLIFDSKDENKELVTKKYNYVSNGVRNKIKEVCSDDCDYEKGYMKTKFNSDDNLPLNKLL